MLGVCRRPILCKYRLFLVQCLLHWDVFFEWSILLFLVHKGPVWKSNRVERLQRMPKRVYHYCHGVFRVFSM